MGKVSAPWLALVLLFVPDNLHLKTARQEPKLAAKLQFEREIKVRP